MPSENWQKVKALFDAASEIEPKKRGRFLQNACGEDVKLRLAVEKLLASFDNAESFLESPAVGEVASVIIENNTKLETGQKLGFYEVISNIGMGGMGEVYLAKDTRLNRKAALKVLPADLIRDESRLKRFRLEAQTASSLNHPNIITIYEIGDFDKTQFIATEFIEGKTLREKIRQTDLEIIDVLEIAIAVASGLSVAHKAGVVHRDIKPENIMIRPDGIVKILDFGLAKLTEPRHGDGETRGRGDENVELLAASSHLRVSASLTNPGTVMGTVNYMSPEQAKGATVDGRTDLWSLGVCLYEIFTGNLPFEGKTINHTLVAIMENEPKKFEPINEYGSAEIGKIIYKLLEKSPNDRYQTAEILLEELRQTKQILRNQSDTKETILFNRSIESKNIAETVTSIAVLPFLTHGLTEDEEYLGLGLADSLIMQLSKAKALTVRPTNAVRSFTDAERDANEIGRKLDVGAVLEGNLQRSGERLRVSVQLINTETQATLWADKFTTEIIDFFDVQDEIAEQVSKALLLKLNTIEKEHFEKPQTDNKAAYLEYLKGRYHWDNRNVESIKKAIEQFKKAIELDPTYALAYTGLADSYCNLGIWGEFPADEIFPRAKAAAERALQIDPELAEGYASLGHVKYSWGEDWEDVENNLEKAIELNPNYAPAYGWLARYYSLMHRHEETVKALETAQKLDPLSPQIASSLASSYFFARQFDIAIEKLRRVLEIHPDYIGSIFMLGVAYARNGQFEKAFEFGTKAVEITKGHLVIKGYLGIIYILAGEREKGLEILNELKEKVAENKTLNYSIAAIYAELTEKEEAYRWLEKCFDEKDANLHSMAIDIEFDNLRGDERFNEMLERLGLHKVAELNRKKYRPASILTETNPESLAVLPFATTGLGEEEEYLGLGLADALITQLSRTKQFAVRPTSAVRKYENTNENVTKIGQELRVDSILEANLQKAGERIRVTVQLVDAKNETSLWAEKFLFDFTDIFDVQDEIAIKVSRSLLKDLSSSEHEILKTPRIENTEAYKLYLRGVFHLYKTDPENLQKAIGLFKRSIELSPDLAKSYAGLAEAYILSSYISPTLQDILPKAKEAAQKASELDPHSVEAVVSLGIVKSLFDWDWSGAEKEFQKALEINSNFETTYRFYGTLLNSQRRFNEAIEVYNKGLKINPFSLPINAYLAMIYYCMGRTESAIGQSLKTLELEPNYHPALGFLGMSYLAKGDTAAAIRTFEKQTQTSPSPIAMANLGHAFAVDGEENDARIILSQLENDIKSGQVSSFYLALIHIGLDEKKKALDYLEISFKQHEVLLPGLMNTDPRFQVLADEPRFQNLLKQIGL